MTLRGAELLRAELKRLKSEERPRVIKAIAEARSHGDLTENAEYHAAREQQGFIEGRISEIEAQAGERRRSSTSRSSRRHGKVVFGATVELEDQDERQARHLPDRRRGRGRHPRRAHLHHLADRARADRQARATWSTSPRPAARAATRSSRCATSERAGSSRRRAAAGWLGCAAGRAPRHGRCACTSALPVRCASCVEQRIALRRGRRRAPCTLMSSWSLQRAVRSRRTTPSVRPALPMHDHGLEGVRQAAQEALLVLGQCPWRRIMAMTRRSPEQHRWLQEHVSDPFVQARQAEGWRSRAVFKLEEIDRRERLLQPGARGARPRRGARRLEPVRARAGRRQGAGDRRRPAADGRRSPASNSSRATSASSRCSSSCWRWPASAGRSCAVRHGPQHQRHGRGRSAPGDAPGRAGAGFAPAGLEARRQRS